MDIDLYITSSDSRALNTSPPQTKTVGLPEQTLQKHLSDAERQSFSKHQTGIFSITVIRIQAIIKFAIMPSPKRLNIFGPLLNPLDLPGHVCRDPYGLGPPQIAGFWNSLSVGTDQYPHCHWPICDDVPAAGQS
jgi:hypothetical protein